MKFANYFKGKTKLIIIIIVMLISFIVPDALPFVDELLLFLVAILEYFDSKDNKIKIN